MVPPVLPQKAIRECVNRQATSIHQWTIAPSTLSCVAMVAAASTMLMALLVNVMMALPSTLLVTFVKVKPCSVVLFYGLSFFFLLNPIS